MGAPIFEHLKGGSTLTGPGPSLQAHFSVNTKFACGS